MNILYITHEYGGRWVKYATFLRQLGHNVDLIVLKDKRTPNQVTVKRYSPEYNIVWAFAADYIWYKVLSDDFVDAVKNGRSVFIGWCTLNTAIPFKDWVNNFRVYDTCFLHSKLVTEMAKAVGLTNVHYMPYGFDKDEYYKINAKKKFDVTFVGSAQTNMLPEQDARVQIINALKEFDIRVFGASLKGRVGRSIQVTPFSSHVEMNTVYNRSKINLNIPLINSALPEFRDKYHPKNRFYEIPGSGNFMLSGYADEFNEQFKDGVHCAYYYDGIPKWAPNQKDPASDCWAFFRRFATVLGRKCPGIQRAFRPSLEISVGDLCSKVEYYLTHEEEREEIALAGYHHALKYHQTMFRFRDMMNIIEERHF